MTDKHDYTATIRGKGLDGTGVTEDIAKSMYHSMGKRTLAIVELVHKRQINDEDTGRKVELAISMLEPSTDPKLDDYLRNLTKTLHQNRVLKSSDEQLQIETQDDLEPTVEQVIAAGQQHLAETDDPLPDTDVDADDVDEGEGTDSHDEPGELWEYDAPEGQTPTTVPDPFTPTVPDPTPAA